MAREGELTEVRLLGLPLRLRNLFLRHTDGLLRELALIQIGEEQHSGHSLPRRLLEVADELSGTYAPFQARPAAEMDAAAAAGAEFCDVVYAVPQQVGPFVRRLADVLDEADGFCRAHRHLLTLPPAEEVVAYRRWVFDEFLRQLAGEEPRPWHRPAEPAAAPAVAPSSAGERRPPPAGAVDGAGGAAPGGEVVGQPLVLDPLASAVVEARRYVRRTLHLLDAEDVEDSAELGVSELVTNALLHARSAFTLTVRVMPSGRVRIEVSDSSPVPVQRRNFGLSATTGRGLRLVESISSDWGIDVHATGRGPGKTVWFEPRATVTETEIDLGDWSAELQDLL